MNAGDEKVTARSLAFRMQLRARCEKVEQWPLHRAANTLHFLVLYAAHETNATMPRKECNSCDA